jgi:hypothetical protein
MRNQGGQNEKIGGPAKTTVIGTAGVERIVVPGGDFMLVAEYIRKGDDLILVGADGTRILIKDYFASENPPTLANETGAAIDAALVGKLAGPQAPGLYAQAGNGDKASDGGGPVGKVDTLTGSVEVKRADGTRSSLNKGDPLFEGDVLATGQAASVGMTFADGTTLSLGEKGRLVLDHLAYDPGAKTGEAQISLLGGSFAMVSGQISKTAPDALSIKTPTMTVGIRGTGVTGNSSTVAMMQEAGGVTGEVTLTTGNGQTMTLNVPGQAATIGPTGGLTKTIMTPQQVMQVGGGIAASLPNASTALSATYNDAARQAQQQIQQQQQQEQQQPQGPAEGNKPQSILTPAQEQQARIQAQPLVNVLAEMQKAATGELDSLKLPPAPPTALLINDRPPPPQQILHLVDDGSQAAFAGAKGFHDASVDARNAAQGQRDQVAGRIGALQTALDANSAAILAAKQNDAALPAAAAQVIAEISEIQTGVAGQRTAALAAATQAALIARVFPLAKAEAEAALIVANSIVELATDASDAVKIASAMVLAEAIEAAAAQAATLTAQVDAISDSMGQAIAAAQAEVGLTGGNAFDAALDAELAALAAPAAAKQTELAALIVKVNALKAEAMALDLDGTDPGLNNTFTATLAEVVTDSGSAAAQAAVMNTAVTGIDSIIANPSAFANSILTAWTSGAAATAEATAEDTREAAEVVVTTDQAALTTLVSDLQTLRNGEVTLLNNYQAALAIQSAYDVAEAAALAIKVNATNAHDAWGATFLAKFSGAASELNAAVAVSAGASRDASVTAAATKVAAAITLATDGYNQAVLTYYNATHTPDWAGNLAAFVASGATFTAAVTDAETNDFATGSWVVAKTVANTAQAALTGLSNSDDVAVGAAAIVMGQASGAANSLEDYYEGLYNTYAQSYTDVVADGDAQQLVTDAAEDAYNDHAALITAKQTAIETKLTATLGHIDAVSTAKAAEASAEWYLDAARVAAVTKAETDLATAVANAATHAATAIAKAGSSDTSKVDGNGDPLDAATAAAQAKAAADGAYAAYQADNNYSLVGGNKTAAYLNFHASALEADTLADTFDAAAAQALTDAQTALAAVQTAIAWAQTYNVHTAAMATSLTTAQAAVTNATQAATAAHQAALATQAALTLVIATDPDPAAVAAGLIAQGNTEAAANSAALAKLKQEAADGASQAAYQNQQAEDALTLATAAKTAFDSYTAQANADVTTLNGHRAAALAAQTAADAAADRAAVLATQAQAAGSVPAVRALLGDSIHLHSTTGDTVLNANGTYASGDSIATTIAGIADDVSTALYIAKVKAALAQTEADAAVASAAIIADILADAAVAAAAADITAAATAATDATTGLATAKTALAAMSLASNSAADVNTAVDLVLARKSTANDKLTDAQAHLAIVVAAADNLAALGADVDDEAKAIAQARATVEAKVATLQKHLQTASTAYDQALTVKSGASAKHDALVFAQDSMDAAAAAAAQAAAEAQAQVAASKAARAAAETQAETTADAEADKAETKTGDVDLLTETGGNGLNTVTKTYKVGNAAQTSVTVTDAVTAEIQTYLDFWAGNLSKVADDAVVAKAYAAGVQADFDAAILAGQGFQKAGDEIARAATALTQAKSTAAVASALATTAENLATAADSWRAGTLISDRIAADAATVTATNVWSAAKSAYDTAYAAAATAQSDSDAPAIAKAAADATLVSQQTSLHTALYKFLDTVGQTPASTALADLIAKVNAYAGTSLAGTATEAQISAAITAKWNATPGDLVQSAWHDAYDSSYSAYENAATAATEADAAATAALARAATLQLQADEAADALTQAQNDLSNAAAAEASAETSEVVGESVAEKQAITLLDDAQSDTSSALTTATTEAGEAATHADVVAAKAADAAAAFSASNGAALTAAVNEAIAARSLAAADDDSAAAAVIVADAALADALIAHDWANSTIPNLANALPQAKDAWTQALTQAQADYAEVVAFNAEVHRQAELVHARRLSADNSYAQVQAVQEQQAAADSASISAAQSSAAALVKANAADADADLAYAKAAQAADLIDGDNTNDGAGVTDVRTKFDTAYADATARLTALTTALGTATTTLTALAGQGVDTAAATALVTAAQNAVDTATTNLAGLTAQANTALTAADTAAASALSADNSAGARATTAATQKAAADAAGDVTTAKAAAAAAAAAAAEGAEFATAARSEAAIAASKVSLVAGLQSQVGSGVAGASNLVTTAVNTTTLLSSRVAATASYNTAAADQALAATKISDITNEIGTSGTAGTEAFRLAALTTLYNTWVVGQTAAASADAQTRAQIEAAYKLAAQADAVIQAAKTKAADLYSKAGTTAEVQDQLAAALSAKNTANAATSASDAIKAASDAKAAADLISQYKALIVAARDTVVNNSGVITTQLTAAQTAEAVLTAATNTKAYSDAAAAAAATAAAQETIAVTKAAQAKAAAALAGDAAAAAANAIIANAAADISALIASADSHAATAHHAALDATTAHNAAHAAHLSADTAHANAVTAATGQAAGSAAAKYVTAALASKTAALASDTAATAANTAAGDADTKAADAALAAHDAATNATAALTKAIEAIEGDIISQAAKSEAAKTVAQADAAIATNAYDDGNAGTATDLHGRLTTVIADMSQWYSDHLTALGTATLSTLSGLITKAGLLDARALAKVTAATTAAGLVSAADSAIDQNVIDIGLLADDPTPDAADFTAAQAERIDTTAQALTATNQAAIAKAAAQAVLQVQANVGAIETSFSAFKSQVGETIKAANAVAIKTSETNAAAVAVADTATVNENIGLTTNSVTVNVLANDKHFDNSAFDSNTVAVNDSVVVSAVGAAANGTVALVGNTIVYTPNKYFSGTETITYTLTDTATLNVAQTKVENSDPASVTLNRVFTATGTLTVSVNHVNVAPTLTNLTAVGAENTSGSQSVAFTATAFTNAYADVNQQALSKVQITALTSHGTMLLSGAAVTLNQEISAAQLGNLSYRPDRYYNGHDTFLWKASDGEAYSASAAVGTLSLQAVATAPTVTAAATAGTEYTAVAPQIPLAIAVTDADASDAISSVTITGVPTGATLSAGTMTDAGAWNLSVAQLANLKLVPPRYFNGGIDLTITATSTDGGKSAQTIKTLHVEIAPTISEPTIAMPASLTERNDAFAHSIPITLTKPDASDSISSVKISGLPAGTSLSLGTTALTATNGTYTLSGGDDLSTLKLNAPAYANGTATLRIAMLINDGALSRTFVGEHAITIAPQATAATLTTADVTRTESAAVANIPLAIAAIDPDASDDSLVIKISGLPAGAALSAGTENSGIYTLTPAQLSGLSLHLPPHRNGAFDLLIQAITTDGTDVRTSVETLRVNIEAAATQPTLIVAPVSGTEATAIPLAIAVTNPDAGDSVSIRITGFPQGTTFSAGELSETTLTLTQEELAGLTMTPPPGAYGVLTLSVAATSADGTSQRTTTGELIVSVTHVNEAPTIAWLNPVVAEENADAAVTGLSIIDDARDGDQLRMTLSATHGVLTVEARDGLTFLSGDGVSDAAMTFTGTKGALNAALESLSYRGNHNFTGEDTIIAAVNDLGNLGSGGAKTGTATMTVSVNPVDDAFVATPENDVFDGAHGADSVTYGGAMTDYALSTDASGIMTVIDVTGADGVDSLKDIETLFFADGSLTIAGAAGARILLGGSGNENIRVGSGFLGIELGGGNDAIEISSADLTALTTLSGGAGTDEIILSQTPFAVSDSLFAHVSGFETVSLPAAENLTLSLGTQTALSGIGTIRAEAVSGKLTLAETGPTGSDITLIGGTGTVALPSSMAGALTLIELGNAGVLDASALPELGIKGARRVGNDLTLELSEAAGGGSLIVRDQFAGTGVGIDHAISGGGKDSIAKFIGSVAGNATLTGGAGHEIFVYDQTAATLIGGGGEDTFFAAHANQTIIGDGTAGNGGIVGGKVNFAYANGPVVANATQATFDGFTATLININRLVGSAHDDTLVGGLGQSVLEGGAGNNVLIGGTGTVLASYQSAPSRIVANLSEYELTIGTLSAAAGTVLNGFGGTDSLSGITRIRGSLGDDVIKGGANGLWSLDGNGGADTLISGGGDTNFRVGVNDGATVIGGIGKDRLSFIDFADGTLADGAFVSTSGTEILSINAGGAAIPPTSVIFGAVSENAGLTTLDAYGMGPASVSLDAAARTNAITFVSSAGADLFAGGEGDDTFRAGAGIDMATFRGAKDGYRLSVGNGTVFVEDIDAGNGNDGRDALENVERLSFADGTLTVSAELAAKGLETLANAETNGPQRNAHLARLSDGGHVATWTSYGQDGDNWGVHGQRYDAFGNKVGGEFQINAYAADEQLADSVIGLPGGGFAVAWQSNLQDANSWGVYARTFPASYPIAGSPSGEFLVNAGNVIGFQGGPALAATNDGFMIAWVDETQIRGKRLNIDGSAAGTEFTIASANVSEPVEALITLSNGDAVAFWRGQDEDANGAFGQRTNHFGELIGGQFRLNSIAAGDQFGVSAVATSDGGFIAAWHSNPTGNANEQDIVARRFNAAGMPIGEEIQIATAAGLQTNPSIVALPDGGFFAVWESQAQGARNVFGRRFGADGGTAEEEIQLSQGNRDAEMRPDVIALPNGELVVTWSDIDVSDQEGIHSRRISLDEILTGSAAADVLDLGTGFDAVDGGMGDDVIKLQAFSLNSMNAVTGGDGVDTLILSGGGFIGAAELSKISGIELLKLNGTGYLSLVMGGNDSFETIDASGSSGGLSLNASAAERGITMIGGAGSATMIGGVGSDVFSVATEEANAMISGWAGNFNVNFIGPQTGSGLFLSNVEELRFGDGGALSLNYSNGIATVAGSLGNDVINANYSGPSVIDAGDGGSDTLSGGYGGVVFRLNGGLDGTDTVIGGFGPDTLRISGGTLTDQAFANIANVETLSVTGSANVTLGTMAAQAGIGKVDASSATGGLTIDVGSSTTPINVIGGSGDDAMRGGMGNHFFDGGTGEDSATFGGAKQGYRLSVIDGAVVVQDINPGDGDDGTDFLQNVEKLNFSDGTTTITKSAGTLAPMGEATAVNSFSIGDQISPSIAPLSDGGYVITWNSANQDDFSWGVYARRYSAAGIPQGDEFQVATAASREQWGQQVTALSDGGFAIVWHSNGQDGSDWGVYAKTFPASYPAAGEPSVEILIPTTTSGFQAWPHVTGLPGGGFLALWDGGEPRHVFGRAFHADGTAATGEFQISTNPVNDPVEDVAILTNGDVVALWHAPDGDASGLFARRITPVGIPTGPVFQINEEFVSEQYGGSIAPLAGGGFVVTWHSFGQDGDDWGVMGRVYDSAGIPGNEFIINSYAQGFQAWASVTPMNDGGFLAAWDSAPNLASKNIFGQRFDAAGAKLGSEFQISFADHFGDERPTVATLENGDVVVTWHQNDDSGGGVFSKRYSFAAADAPILSGSAGNDFLDVGPGFSAVDAGAGDDVVRISAGDLTSMNSAIGGAGIDAMILSGGVMDAAALSKAKGFEELRLNGPDQTFLIGGNGNPFETGQTTGGYDGFSGVTISNGGILSLATDSGFRTGGRLKLNGGTITGSGTLNQIGGTVTMTGQGNLIGADFMNAAATLLLVEAISGGSTATIEHHFDNHGIVKLSSDDSNSADWRAELNANDAMINHGTVISTGQPGSGANVLTADSLANHGVIQVEHNLILRTNHFDNYAEIALNGTGTALTIQNDS